jgi:sulfur relay (sulfurtransferase) complex TusBCD TusD component (DsrE family)
MKLGLLLITKGYKEDVIGLINSAEKQGHTVTVFMMDDGVYYCQDSDIVALNNLENINMSLCDRSCQLRDISSDMIPDGIVEGSQLQNAMMFNSTDRVINI